MLFEAFSGFEMDFFLHAFVADEGDYQGVGTGRGLDLECSFFIGGGTVGGILEMGGGIEDRLFPARFLGKDFAGNDARILLVCSVLLGNERKAR